MNEYNIYFNIKGAGGTQNRVPNKHNPVRVENMGSVLRDLADQLPTMGGLLEIIGVTVELHRGG